MHMIINSFDKNNIIYETKCDKVVLKYKIDKFKILGIPLKIIYDKIEYSNYMTNIYIIDEKTLDILEQIENNTTNKYNLIKVNKKNNKKYITCKNKINNKLSNDLYISIVKIFNNNYYNYII